MKLWLMTVGEPLPLPGTQVRLWRTGLLAKTLVARGHSVTWWTSSVDHFNKCSFTNASERRVVERGLTLQFLHGRLYQRNVSPARWCNHRQIASQFVRLAPTHEDPDVILCSYPTIELSAAAVRYGHAKDIPVLLDIRDLWPDEMAVRLPRSLRPLARWLLWPMYRQAEFALRGANGLVAVSQRYLGWGLAHARRERTPIDAIFTHGYPTPASTDRADARSLRWLAERGIDGTRRVFWFAGTFVGSIDLDTVIDAAKRLRDHPDVLFVLSGSGERDGEWRDKARGLDNVVFTGWLDREQLCALASVAWVGLGAYKRGALMSLTNKIFEYMAYGLPVLSALPGEARGIIERGGCGEFYEPGSASALASAIRRLCGDSARRDAMAARARQLFQRDYAAEAVYPRLAEHLETVVASSR